MRTHVLILALADLPLEDQELADALNNLKRLGAVTSYRRNCKTVRIEMDPVRAELVMETFTSSQLPDSPKGIRSARS